MSWRVLLLRALQAGIMLGVGAATYVGLMVAAHPELARSPAPGRECCPCGGDHLDRESSPDDDPDLMGEDESPQFSWL